jgi:AraC-like DNA-binding protein
VTDFVDSRAEAQLARLLEERFAAKLEGWLGERLEQSPTAEEAAAAFRMARRTLHRQLRAAGTTFQALHQRLLRERAHRMLAAGRAVSEVADTLGYADTSSFCRAYRRWTGQSPAAQRGAS